MKHKPTGRGDRAQAVLAIALTLLLTGVSFAAETVVNLHAEVISKPLPGGGSVPMWAFGLVGEDATVPGPPIVVPPGDTLKINLTNNLPTSVSIMIPGQAAATDGVGLLPAVARTNDGRVRAFTHETAPTVTGTYVWANIKPGTYLYHSGSHISVQVPMGLYGALTNDAAAGQAYTGVAYSQQKTLLYSEIDTALNEAVDDGTYGNAAYPSTIKYQANWFLVNGEPFTTKAAATIDVNTGSPLLIRLLNAGLESHVPLFQGLYVDAIAEDGNVYPIPKSQYNVLLPAGKTIDVRIANPPLGEYPIYDRRGFLTNDAAGPGGFLTFLNVLP